MNKKIAILAGDGIGPEVMNQTIRILKKIEQKYNHHFTLIEKNVGGIAIDENGEALPKDTLNTCEMADAILFGSVGGPKWEKLNPDLQPERAALLPLRKHFKLFANIRPAICYPELAHASPLKNSIVKNGFDIMCIRELTGGIYFGKPKSISTESNNTKTAIDTMVYNENEIKKITHIAFENAQKRSKKLCSIDKANVLQNGVLWRETVEEISKQYTDVTLTHLYVDNAAMQVLKYPTEFDVILTPNLFGDILSDEIAMLTGSLGLLASASLNDKKFGLFEPSGGSAPDIAGKGIANPIAQIMSLALLLKLSFNLIKEAKNIEDAIKKTIKLNYRTQDIISDNKKEILVNTKEITDQILNNI